MASSNRPIRLAMAPVKAPFSWPKSSLSRRLSGIAAQLTQTNGLVLARRLRMNVSGHDLLAGPALASDEHGGFGTGDLFGELHDPFHRGIAPDEGAGCRPRPLR